MSIEESIILELEALKARVEALESQEVRAIRYSEANVSNPPTDAEIDSIWTGPSSVGEGFIGIIDDNNADTTVWLIVSTGTSWWYESLTKAV